MPSRSCSCATRTCVLLAPSTGDRAVPGLRPHLRMMGGLTSVLRRSSAWACVRSWAHVCVVRQRRCVASLAMTFEFSKLPFAVGVVAYLAFGEVIDAWTWIGAVIIFASAVYITRREAPQSQRASGAYRSEVALSSTSASGQGVFPDS
jgi:hypothetical protein